MSSLLRKLKNESRAVFQEEPGADIVKALGALLSRRIVILETEKKFWKDVQYSVLTKGLLHKDELVMTFPEVRIESIDLAYYPGNDETTDLARELFKKVIADGDPVFKIRGERNSIFFYNLGFYQFPILKGKESDREKLLAKTQGIIDIYVEHDKEFQVLMKKLRRDYPETKADAERWIVKNDLPLSILYPTEGVEVTLIQHLIVNENTGLFVPNENKLDWYINNALVVLEYPELAKQEISKRYLSERIGNYETYKKVMIESLRMVDASPYGTVDWERIYSIFPEAKDIPLNPERKELQLTYAYRLLEE